MELSDKAMTLLNGHSHRPIVTAHLEAGDILHGELVERGERRNGSEKPFAVLTLRLLEPGRFGGEDRGAGDWVRVPCPSGVMRRLVAAEDPQPGDRVALHHRGKVGGRLDLVAGVGKADPKAW